MALISCPDCGKQISDQAPACIHCGRPMLSEKGKLIIKGKYEGGFNKHLYFLYDQNGNFFDEVPAGEEKCYHIDQPITLILGHKRGSFFGCAVANSAPTCIDPEKVTRLEASITPGLTARQYRLLPMDVSK